MYASTRQQTRPFSIDMGDVTKARVTFFNMVYAWMSVGLAVTGVVAWLASQSPTWVNLLYTNRLVFSGLFLGMIGIAVFAQAAALRISVGAGLGLFMLYAALMGAMISAIFLVYPKSTIASSFAVTGGTFACISIYGFVTKRSLATFGSYMYMALGGVILASVVNFFVASNAMSWIITYGVLAVFIGITAYETQKLKQIADATANNSSLAARYAVIGSLMLYLAFMNMFLSILRIMGDRR